MDRVAALRAYLMREWDLQPRPIPAEPAARAFA
jgi:hypothetical protein